MTAQVVQMPYTPKRQMEIEIVMDLLDPSTPPHIRKLLINQWVAMGNDLHKLNRLRRDLANV